MMHRTVFEPTFAGWRAAARRLLEEGVAPAEAAFEARDGEQLGLRTPHPPAPSPELPGEGEHGGVVRATGYRVPRSFFETGEAAACHASPERWALLYRVLWRLTHGEPHLLEVAVDPDVHRLLAMEKAVRREIHKLHAFVRFRAVAAEDGEPHYVAWFEPAHPVVERAAPFFAERFASMRWSILTPRRCAHWDGEALSFTPGLPRTAAPTADALEALWRTYYASTFNPARVRTHAMRAEMPVRYWRNLPEAAQIGELVRDAPARVRRMVERQGLPAELARPPRPARGT